MSMTNQQGAPEALRTITRYEVVDCIDSKHVPAVIPNKDGPWVLYADHLAALVEAQQPAPSAAAGMDELRRAFEPQTVEQEWKGSHSLAYPATAARIINAARALPSPTPQADSQPAPIDMVLHCPKCGVQHIDASEPPVEFEPGAAQWSNPPHRSHLCHGCGHIWRPADVPTNGVEAVKTTGKADSPIAASAPADSVTAAAGGVVAGPIYRIRTKNTKHVVWTTVPKHEYLAALEAPEIFECELISAPPAKAADSVLEDAARYRWLRHCDLDDMAVKYWPDGEVPTGVEFDAAVDAARKQGGGT